MRARCGITVVVSNERPMKGVTMNDNNTYKVFYKTAAAGSGCIETLAEFTCDKERYMHEIEKAMKNHVSFTASDSVFCNEFGGRDYWMSVYIW